MTNEVKEYSFRKEFVDVGFEIVELERFIRTQAAVERVTPHRIRFYVILFITAGKGVHQINFHSYPYQQGDLIFVDKDQIHSWKDCDSVEGYILLFTKEFLSDNQTKFNKLSYRYPFNITLYKPILNLHESYKTFYSLIQYLHQEYSLPASDSKKEILQNLLRTVFLKIQSHPMENADKVDLEMKELFIRFQQLLDERIHQTRNANDYCSMLNVHYKKLNAACNTFANKSIKVFIDDTLILRSKQLLLGTGGKISQISYALGFDEVTNFTKYFKKHTGFSPRAFLALYR